MSLFDAAYYGQNCSLRKQDEDGLMHTFSSIIDGPVTLIIIIVGVLTNLYVTRQRFCGRAGSGSSDPSTILDVPFWHSRFLTTTAFLIGWDTFLMLVTVVYYSLEANLALTTISASGLQHLYVLLHPFASISFMCTAWFPVLMMIQSYHALVYPFRNMDWLRIHEKRSRSTRRHEHRQKCRQLRKLRRRLSTVIVASDNTHRRQWFCCCVDGNRRCVTSLLPPIAVNVLALLVSLPTFGELVASVCVDRESGLSGIEISPTVLRASTWYKMSYRLCRQLLVNLAPFIAMLTLRICTERALRRYRREHEALIELRFRGTIHRVAERASADAGNWVLRLFTAKFMLLRLLSTISDVIELAHFPSRNWLLKYLATSSNAFVLLNSATNGALIFLSKKALKSFFVKQILKDERVKADRIRQRNGAQLSTLKRDPLVGAEGFFILQSLTAHNPAGVADRRRTHTDM